LYDDLADLILGAVATGEGAFNPTSAAPPVVLQATQSTEARDSSPDQDIFTQHDFPLDPALANEGGPLLKQRSFSETSDEQDTTDDGISSPVQEVYYIFHVLKPPGIMSLPGNLSKTCPCYI
jgi:hypothetical protein